MLVVFKELITNVIPDNLKEIVDYVADYVADSTDDWFLIKRELVNNFPPKERVRFSRRHFSTKKHTINDFDRLVIDYWENLTGNKLSINEDKLHSQNWVQKPKGWGLKKYNDERKRNKSTSANN